VAGLVSQVLKTREPVLECEVSPPNRPDTAYLYSVVPVFLDDGGDTGVLVVGNNVSDLKRAEIGLQEGENRCNIDNSK
jgi:hypothetical protein